MAIELDDKGLPVLPSNRRWVVEKNWDGNIRVALEELCYRKGMFRKEDVYITLQVEHIRFNPEDDIEELDRKVRESVRYQYGLQHDMDEVLRLMKEERLKEETDRKVIEEKKKKKVDQYLDKYWGRSR